MNNTLPVRHGRWCVTLVSNGGGTVTTRCYEPGQGSGMAGSGIGRIRIPEFGPSLETFGTYTRRVEQYFIANGVEEKEDVRRRAIFLSAVGVNTFSLL